MVAVHMLSFCLDFSFFSYNQKRKTSDIVSTFALVCVNYLIFYYTLSDPSGRKTTAYSYPVSFHVSQ